MSKSRPRWADADVPLALLVGLVLVLAFVLPGILSGRNSGATTPRAVPSGHPSSSVPMSPTESGQEVLPASPITPGAPANPRGKPSATPVPPALARPAGPGTCVDVPGPRMTAATFNMHSGFNRDRSAVELDQIAAEIEASHADVVMLQEVDRFRRWTGDVDQPAYLAEKLGMYYAFGPNVLRGGNNQYGTAILSRYPIDKADNTLLPNAAGGQQRGLLHAQISPFGKPVSIYDTHLEHRSADLRDAQAQAIAGIVAQDPLPKVLGGDLNSTPGTTVLSTLRGQLGDGWVAGQGRGFTHPAGAPSSRIDYLMYDDGPRPVLSQVLPGAVSDHLAVRTIFEMEPPTKVCVPLQP